MGIQNKHCIGILKQYRAARQILLLIILLGLFTPHAAGENTAVNVLVLPFDVRAPEEVAYLRTQIASVLAEHLERDGASPISLKQTDLAEVMGKPIGEDEIRQLAKQYAADQVIYGSFTLIGDNYSLDARMLKPSDRARPTTFSAQGKGLENLLNTLKKLSGKIGLKLFKHKIISHVQVQGNQRIETDAILRFVKAKPGGVFQRGLLSDDLRSVYAMGWFDDVRVELESKNDSQTIIFHVKEKPVIRRIKIKGNQFIDEDKIKENLSINTGAILNSKKIRTNIEQIEMLYKGKNYHDIKVDYKLRPLKKNQADIDFIIDEGEKLYITEIRFEGNHEITEKKLHKIIATNEKGFFSWLTSSGDFDRTELNQDTARLRQFYHNEGYIRARVGEPHVDFQQEGILVTFKIEEGQRYKVGKVDITGDLLADFDKDAYIKTLQITQSIYFSREKMRKDIITIKDLYGEQGYAYADIKPLTSQSPDNLMVDVTYKVAKGDEVYFENITISGNTRTRDKVIRRQLKIYEQERFDGSALKRSVRNLHRTSYFEDIKVDTAKGSGDDKMGVNIEVTEKATGMFTFGAGYSTEENVFMMGQISERNLFGRGQILKFSGTLGSSTTQYTLSFTEPWLFDTPLSSTISAYDQEKEYENEYDRHTIGGGLQFGYPLFDYTRGYIAYAYDVSDVTIDEENIPNVSNNIIELEGENVTSSIMLQVVYDSRDSRIRPTEGSKHSVSFEYAGLGGDIGYDKYRVEVGKYWPLTKNLIFFAHGKYGHVYKNADDKLLPDYEKFYLGGINSLRGFPSRGVHLTEINAEDEEVKIGGNDMVQFNFELIFPIAKEAGVMGLVFYDTGNVYEDNIDLDDMRSSYGAGIRWFSPMAPIRLEYGRIIDRREGESQGRWEFTLGGAF